jgi:Ca2+-transporting ATPase
MSLDKITTNQQPLIAEFDRKANDLANEGYRLLLCHKRNTILARDFKYRGDRIVINLYRICRMIDPPRRRSKKAVSEC